MQSSRGTGTSGFPQRLNGPDRPEIGLASRSLKKEQTQRVDGSIARLREKVLPPPSGRTISALNPRVVIHAVNKGAMKTSISPGIQPERIPHRAVESIKKELRDAAPITNPKVLAQYVSHSDGPETTIEAVQQYDSDTLAEPRVFTAIREEIHVLRSRGDDIAARKRYKEVLTRYPEKSIHRAILLSEAASLFAEAERLDETFSAMDMYLEAAAIYESSPSKRESAIECYRKVTVLYRKNMFSFEKEFERSLQVANCYAHFDPSECVVLRLDLFSRKGIVPDFNDLGDFDLRAFSPGKLQEFAEILKSFWDLFLTDPSATETRKWLFEKIRFVSDLCYSRATDATVSLSLHSQAELLERAAILYEYGESKTDKAVAAYRKSLIQYYESGDRKKAGLIGQKLLEFFSPEARTGVLEEYPWFYDCIKYAATFYVSSRDDVKAIPLLTTILQNGTHSHRYEEEIATFLEKAILAFKGYPRLDTQVNQWIEQLVALYRSKAEASHDPASRASLNRMLALTLKKTSRNDERAMEFSIASAAMYEDLASKCGPGELLQKARFHELAALCYTFPSGAGTIVFDVEKHKVQSLAAAECYKALASLPSTTEKGAFFEQAAKAFALAGNNVKALQQYRSAGEAFMRSADSIDRPDSEVDLTSLAIKYESAARCFMNCEAYDKAVEARHKCSERIPFDRTHPLFNMSQNLDRCSKDKPLERMGAYFQDLDTGKIKRRTMHASRRKVCVTRGEEPKRIALFDFQLTHPSREALEKTIQLAESNPQLLGLQGPPINSSYRIPAYIQESDTYSFPDGLEVGVGKELIFPGLGRVRLSASPDQHSLYNRVEIMIEEQDVERPPGNGLRKLHSILSMLGLGTTLLASREEDKVREKLFLLCHTFFPTVAYTLEKESENLELPVAELRAKIESIESGAAAIFSKYLEEHPELLEERELYTGRSSFFIRDMGEQIRQSQACGLLFGTKSDACSRLPWESNFEEAKRSFRIIANRYVQNLRAGVAMTSNREDIVCQGLITSGSTPDEDTRQGGMDSVFTRMVSNRAAEASYNLFDNDVLYNQDGIRVLLDCDIAGFESTYGYEADSHGRRAPADDKRDSLGTPAIGCKYEERRTLPMLAEYIQERFRRNPFDVACNETMVRDLAPTEFIRGILVPGQEMKVILSEELRTAGLIIEKEIDGRMISYVQLPGGMAKPVDQFLYVGNSPRKEMWDR